MSKEHKAAKEMGHEAGKAITRWMLEYTESRSYCPLCFSMPLLVELATGALVLGTTDEDTVMAFLNEFSETVYFLVEERKKFMAEAGSAATKMH